LGITHISHFWNFIHMHKAQSLLSGNVAWVWFQQQFFDHSHLTSPAQQVETKNTTVQFPLQELPLVSHRMLKAHAIEMYPFHSFPGGKVNILGGHNIGHSKQKSVYVCVLFWTVSITHYVIEQFVSCIHFSSVHFTLLPTPQTKI
jgi:hypothetical protein